MSSFLKKPKRKLQFGNEKTPYRQVVTVVEFDRTKNLAMNILGMARVNAFYEKLSVRIEDPNKVDTSVIGGVMLLGNDDFYLCGNKTLTTNATSSKRWLFTVDNITVVTPEGDITEGPCTAVVTPAKKHLILPEKLYRSVMSNLNARPGNTTVKCKYRDVIPHLKIVVNGELLLIPGSNWLLPLSVSIYTFQ
ncbi:unnamed protein product [Gongylonema pulchrum]|uniref:Doublecortin domain-containing protein n=1 Tax=Gongylonema pulchrum TaxID=637853 RepID=A0A183DYC2_9BILA|nr:unnamed protein product [Gongylonema pulchrum]